MYQRILPEVETLPPELRRAWTYYGLFPAAVMQVGPDLVGCYQVLPVGPEQCRIHGFQIAHEDPRREMRAARYLSNRIVRQVVKEDIDFCTWTNSGVRSTRYSGGFLSEHESGVEWFQNRIRELIPIANLPDRPALGQVARIDREMARERANRKMVARPT
jgi:phenylpropionate dioxygenase-like ring-hydroxylating dioxygenase large terminal subunit